MTDEITPEPGQDDARAPYETPEVEDLSTDQGPLATAPGNVTAVAAPREL